MSVSNSNSNNTKINEIRQNTNSEYSEELKLNIRCANNDSHVAVLFCTFCKISQCKKCSDELHSNVLSNHEIVRLTQKPEPPINCYLHPDELAKLVCKEPNCEGVNKPICTTCHQYQTHKNHKYGMIEYELNYVRANITKCLEEIEMNQNVCDMSLEEYDKCISSYSITDPGFMKNERDKVDKFYSDLRASALKRFDDFVNDRIEKLKASKNRYQSEKVKLDELTSELRNMKEMKKVEIIKSGENMEKLKIQVRKPIDKPTDLLPSKCYDITLPNIEVKSIDIKIDLSKNYQLHILSKMNAVWCDNIYISDLFDRSDLLKIDHPSDDYLFKYKNGQSIIHLRSVPTDKTIDLSLYKYLIVMFCWLGRETEVMNKLKEKMNIKWCSRIFVLIDGGNWDKKMKYVDRFREIAKTDNRVELIKNDYEKILNYQEILGLLLKS